MTEARRPQIYQENTRMRRLGYRFSLATISNNRTAFSSFDISKVMSDSADGKEGTTGIGLLNCGASKIIGRGYYAEQALESKENRTGFHRIGVGFPL
jgi:hypothetical protein